MIEIVKPIREYLERDAQRPLPSTILSKLALLRNAETRRKQAMYPPRRVVKRRLNRWI
jgi:hypothetical protein